MNRCEQLKLALIDDGYDAVVESELYRQHCEACEDCRALLAAYEAIPDLLDALPEHEPDEAMITDTLETIEAGVEPSTTGSWIRRRLSPALASVLVVMALVGVSREYFSRLADPVSREAGRGTSNFSSKPAGPYTASEEELEKARDAYRQRDRRNEGNQPAASEPVSSGGFLDDFSVTDTVRKENRLALETEPAAVEQQRLRELEAEEDALMLGQSVDQDDGSSSMNAKLDEIVVTGSRLKRADIEVPASTTPESPAKQVAGGDGRASGALQSLPEPAEEQIADYDGLYRHSADRSITSEDVPSSPPSRVMMQIKPKPTDSGDEVFEQEMNESARLRVQQEVSRRPQPLKNEELRRQSSADEVGKKAKDKGLVSEVTISSPSTSLVIDEEVDIEEFKRQLAQQQADGRVSKEQGYSVTTPNSSTLAQKSHWVTQDFLERYSQSIGLEFQDAEGYWANTYIPGDPAMRLLHARLSQWNRAELGTGKGVDLALEQTAQPYSQPFDFPDNHSLTVNLLADANAVEGPTRMRVQVGVRAIEHRSGQRPGVNLGVVVDLPQNVSDAARQSTRALLDALIASRAPGDHFNLIMTGLPESQIIPADEFSYGRLQLARQSIIEPAQTPAVDALSLDDALHHAAALVKQTDNPSQPIGSSSILLITAGTLDNAETLETFAHDQARDSVTTSVVPLGQATPLATVDRIVLAGLGNRRTLDTAEQAQALIEDELYSASRAVARAARLSIRLRPGVQLIDVIGSKRLDQLQSQRVRDIEQSMDRRLSQNLGITADRGEDEDGIQIVIPSLYTGDSHTILLDVLVDKAGPVADVSLRYKDLVFLKNGVLRDHLVLPRGELKRGPAELSVLKNLFATELASAVRQAAAALGNGNAQLAEAWLRRILRELEQARNDIPVWRNDAELTHDRDMLKQYIEVMQQGIPVSQQSILSDSLRYAAWAKTHRALEEWNQ